MANVEATMRDKSGTSNARYLRFDDKQNIAVNDLNVNSAQSFYTSHGLTSPKITAESTKTKTHQDYINMVSITNFQR